MKKIIMGIAAVFAMFCLIGCPTENDDSGSKQDGPKLPGGWTGLDLVVVTGTNPGEIEYGFTATDPVADSYTVWYIAGTKTKAEEIVGVLGALPIQHATAVENQKISNLIPGIVYSFVVVAVKDNDRGYSAVRSAKAKSASTSGFSLTVTGLPPPTAGIYGATLMNPADQTVLAVGTQVNGVFVFYHPLASFPDPTKPYTTAGTYALAIALTDLSTTPITILEIYIYKELITYSATKTGVTVLWSDFSPQGGQQSDESTVITINNKPVEAGILAVMEGGTRIALGLNMTGNTFTLYEPGAMGGPDVTKPWKGSGNYSIFLINPINQQPIASYLKIEGGTPITLYNFTGEAAITFNYTTDFKPIPIP